MSDFLGFVAWAVVILFCFVFVVGFNRQMMEKNRQRDEKIAKKRAKKLEKNGENDEILG